MRKIIKINKDKKGKKTMKKLKLFAYMLGLVLAGATLQSCGDDDDSYIICNNYPGAANALVTVKPQDEGKTVVLQLDDNTTLTPINMSQSPFGNKEVRALCNIRLTEQQTDKRNMKVYVNWIDSILTKRMAPDLGQAENVKAYGNDPVEIMRDWTTVAEDGYLTLRFLTRWGDKQPHLVNLVADNSANPYELTFHHKGNTTSGPKASGLVAFKLSDLPDTNGKTVDVKLKWTSFSGAKSITFKYCTNKSSDLPSETLNKMLEDISNEKNIK